MNMSPKKILLIEPFYGGSHRQLIDLILELFSDSSELYSMPAKKWHWRCITSPLYFANAIPKNHSFRVLFSSSVLPLAELVAIRPDLAKLHKISYFHENQIVYPVQEKKTRYFQHGYNDIMTCDPHIYCIERLQCINTSLVADQVIFNSNFNKESFLKGIKRHLNIVPDFKPKNLEDQIRPKCRVLFFPVDIPKEFQHLLYENQLCSSGNACSSSVLNFGLSCKQQKLDEKLHIVWPHRWEHDKDPETFFSVIYRLKDAGEEFNLSVIGETYSEKPKIFEEAEKYLKDHILNWGYQQSKKDYYAILLTADVVVSTALHEFFGVSMLEASMLNCYPLCPQRLVYPEIYPEKYLYNTPNQLYKKLRSLCRNPKAARNHKAEVNFSQYSWQSMKEYYRNILSKAML